MIEAALFSKLSTWPGLTALIGQRIYPGAAPESAQKPFAVYQKVSSKRSLTNDGASSARWARIQIDCYAKTHDAARAIADQIIEALHGKGWSSGSIAVQVAQLDNDDSSYMPESQLHRADLDFLIYYGVTT